MSKESEYINTSSSSELIQPTGLLGRIARFWKFTENQTNFRQEILAGVTTFMAIADILAVNPSILFNAIFLQQPKDLFGEKCDRHSNISNDCYLNYGFSC